MYRLFAAISRSVSPGTLGERSLLPHRSLFPVALLTASPLGHPETESGGNQTPTVAIVGELNVDLILEQVNQLPALEKERIAEEMTRTMGNSSANLAANAGGWAYRSALSIASATTRLRTE